MKLINKSYKRQSKSYYYGNYYCMYYCFLSYSKNTDLFMKDYGKV